MPHSTGWRPRSPLRLADSNPLVYTVMNGGLIIAGRLLARLNFPLETAYLHASRYGHQLSGNSLLDWRVRPTQELKGRTVLVIDDILDEGHTLTAICQYLRDQGAASVQTAVLVHKEHARKAVRRACVPTSPVSTSPTVSCSAAAWTTRATGATPPAFTHSRGIDRPGRHSGESDGEPCGSRRLTIF